ncbi:ABC transporter permease [uncultured Nocardioides sp.]|uniref:Putative integral membrane transport protein n=1 Tax=uncultured Nocardioides sp. TaxID=198441 RepID=A0A6J4NQ35_9ACTN|nr:ABC transporter permease [uncultured Nocardioides sp.]CAA9394513.1 MAG: putative integral membrane transport protein [uncultured Nocardioides sp.]
MADASVVRAAPRQYAWIALMWIRAALAYPASFWTLTVAGAIITGLDFVGIAIMFTTIDTLGDFGLREIALLYGATGVALGLADMAIGSVEQIGHHVRTGSLDTMLTRPVPLLVQVCADRFALRRLGRISQSAVVLAWAAVPIDWTPARVAVTLMMLVAGLGIFFAFFVAFSCIQFWTADASELANAFTYGGNTMTQYPLTVFPREVVLSLTFLLPVAFVNWYPSLYVLGREDPFGMPSWFAFLSPAVALALLALAALAWRTGVRHYTSTGS